MSDDRLAITVFTWPPLWQYWPAYLAMARAEEDLPGLSFDLKVPPGVATTDVAIRQAFFKMAESTHLLMALCEPYEHEVPGQDGNRSAMIPGQNGNRSAMIRRLPVLSRQPLWVIGKTHFFVGPDSYVARNSAEQFVEMASEPALVWTYPEGTTSGNFARRMIALMQDRSGYSSRIRTQDLNGALSEERAVVAALAESDFLATFTPWHSILEGQGLYGDMLFGPSSEITAVQFRDVPINFNSKVVQEIVAAHLVGVINELAETQGVEPWLKEYVRINWQSVQQFLNRSNFDGLEGLSEGETSAALREYTLLSCYFPYRAMNSAMTVEIQKRVLDVFDSVRERANAEVSRTLSNIFAAEPPWSELTLAARCHVWRSADSVWSLISHEEAPEDHRDVAPLLSDRFARTTATGPTYLLSGLARGLPMKCHYATDDRGTRKLCAKEVAGTVDGQRGGHCAGCSLAGSPGAVARSAAESIASHLGLPVKYEAKLLKQVCPLCFHDVAGLVALFNVESEGRTDDQTEIEVRVYNEFDGEESASKQSESRIVFAIWRRGATSELPTRAGRTGHQMNAWAAAHARAKRSVVWAGAWWRLRDKTFHAVRARNWGSLQDGGALQEWMEDPVSKGNSPLNQARSEFESGGFGFGYVAVFLVGDDENSQAMALQDGDEA